MEFGGRKHIYRAGKPDESIAKVCHLWDHAPGSGENKLSLTMPFRRLRPRLAWAPTLLALSMQPLWAADPGPDLFNAIKKATDSKLQLNFEVRSRLELRDQSEFGQGSATHANFMRTRLGLTYTPTPWIRFNALGQDSRAPFLGRTAPGTMRDPFDLQETYFEILPTAKTGPGGDLGRRMVQYGDTRLIGAPQWAYTARTYDLARAWWRTPHARFELLLVSPIKPTATGWNRPILGDRIWGTYNSWKDLWLKSIVDVYALRHTQNRPGGFATSGRLRTDSLGFRWAALLSKQARFTTEAIIQYGRIANAPHRAYAYVGQIGYKFPLLSRSMDIATEWKYASGGQSPTASHTFDQLSPAAHDKLGHADLLGWKNIQNLRSTAVWALSPKFSLTTMFNDSWLADRTDAAYNAQGRAIARSPRGTAGSHLGRELDLFIGWKRGPYTFAGGGGYFFTGEFFRRTTPGLGQRLFYLSHTYSF